ncbi:GNAT family N-acetyltransferase [Pseudidiomarina marina]|uniref:GNAT family N-acetyltransferase n=1 Tax=Pseudidiomarina marina TaxID=502366 RepID=UPI00385103D8
MKNNKQTIIKFLAEVPESSHVIAKWYFDEWGALDESITLEYMHDVVRKKIANKDQIPLSLVVFVDDDIAGVAELKFHENKNFPEYTHWLGGIFVPPQYRGIGLASKLINKAKAVAEELNVKQLYLQTEPKNISLYESHNFKQLHTAEHMGIQTTIMVTNLAK